MKNLIFAIAILVSLASCGGASTTQNDSTSDSLTTVTGDSTVGMKVDTLAVDSVKVDSVKSVK